MIYIRLAILFAWFLAGLYNVKKMKVEKKNKQTKSVAVLLALFLGPAYFVYTLLQSKGITLKSFKTWFHKQAEQRETKEYQALMLMDNRGRDMFAKGAGLDSDTVNNVRKMIYEAILCKSSDIFIDPKDSAYDVRFRVDGMIRIFETLDEQEALAVVSTIKVASGMDIAEKRRPQDGSFSAVLHEANISFRVASVGVFGGEKITIRVIASENSQRSLEKVGFSKEQLAIIKNGLRLPSGMILMCGPTGSGKTSTLYSMLGEIDYSMKNVISIEDPIERVIPRIAQMEVNAKAQITFASLLRNSLRQNPDIICVGEIRDEETAEIASHAAQTGHLIIATLHSNDNIGTILRLIDLGVPMRSIAGCLHLVISQRLVRLLCPHCKKKTAMTPEQKAFCAQYNIPEQEIYIPGGCPQCGNTGYAGRKAVFEMLIMDAGLRAVMEDPNTSITMIQKYLTENQNSDNIASMTFSMVLKGETSWAEFERVNMNV